MGRVSIATEFGENANNPGSHAKCATGVALEMLCRDR